MRMTRCVHDRALPCSLLLVAVLSLLPSRAAASREFSLEFGEPTLAGTLLITSAIGFGAADLAFIVSERPMPAWLSLLQIGVSGLFLPMNALLSSGSVPLGITAVGTGVWFTSFGIYNVAVYPEYRRKRMREGAYGFAIAPRAHGGTTVQVYARL